MSKENLFSTEAIKKLQDMVDSIDFAMMATDLNSHPIHMIPMSSKKVDDQGRIWFLSNKSSQHNKNIKTNSKLHLIYASKGDMQFLNVFGNANITTDKTIINDLYKGSDDAWFEGKDDPNITAISVAPLEAFYWDPKDSKLVTLVKMGVGAITGNQPDLMDQGELKI